MKILLLFFDMVRTDHINLYNSSAQKCAFDRFFQKIGGTLYTRCYTPAPDTPRSMSCLWSGLLPYKNKCDVRIKWPRYFMDKDIRTIFDNVYDRGYQVHLCANKGYQETGLFKIQDSTKPIFYNNINDFLSRFKNSDNTLCFIANNDPHIVVSDLGGNERIFPKISRLVQDYFDQSVTQEFINQFDYTFFFSDHGMGTLKERVTSKDKLDLLNDGRTNLLMFCHKKGDTTVKIDDRLCTNIDLYATIEKLTGGNDLRDGFSLLDTPQREALHIEDHTDFSVSPEVMIKQWRVITNEIDLRTDIYRTIDKNGASCDFNVILPYLKEVSPKILDLQKEYRVWEHYKALCLPQKQYWAGADRVNPRYAKLYRFAYYILYLIKSRIGLLK